MTSCALSRISTVQSQGINSFRAFGKRGPKCQLFSLLQRHAVSQYSLATCIKLRRSADLKNPHLVQTSRSPFSVVQATAASNMEDKSSPVVDHMVLLKIKPEASAEQIESMGAALLSLSSLQGVLQLYFGEAVSENGEWTHALYGRYASKEALTSYAKSREHVKVVVRHIRPILADICVLDWEDIALVSAADPGVGAVGAAFFTLSDGADEAQHAAIVASLREQQGAIPGLRQVSVGQNFEPDRAKGFTWAFAATFEGVEDLVAYDKNEKNVLKRSVFPSAQSYTRLDFRTAKPAIAKI